MKFIKSKNIWLKLKKFNETHRSCKWIIGASLILVIATSISVPLILKGFPPSKEGKLKIIIEDKFHHEFQTPESLTWNYQKGEISLYDFIKPTQYFHFKGYYSVGHFITEIKMYNTTEKKLEFDKPQKYQYWSIKLIQKNKTYLPAPKGIDGIFLKSYQEYFDAKTTPFKFVMTKY